MKLRSGWQMAYAAVLMLVDWRLQQQASTLWFMFVAPNILLCGENDRGRDITVRTCLTVVAVCWLTYALHLHL
jgi:hypothetical protein